MIKLAKTSVTLVKNLPNLKFLTLKVLSRFKKLESISIILLSKAEIFLKQSRGPKMETSGIFW